MKLNISKETKNMELEIQKKIFNCLDNFQSFCFEAGAGAGKTYSLVSSIEYLIQKNYEIISKRDKKILCITYTNVAKDEILERIGKNSSVHVSTIHDFLWSIIKNQKKLLKELHINKMNEVAKVKKKEFSEAKIYTQLNNKERYRVIFGGEEFQQIFWDNYSKGAKEFKEFIIDYLQQFDVSLKISNVNEFRKEMKAYFTFNKLNSLLYDINNIQQKSVQYIPNRNRDVLTKFIISHDTLLDYAKAIFEKSNFMKKILIDTYPYVFIDEYQDTDHRVVDIFESLRTQKFYENQFLVGYFGDSAQNIFSNGIGSLNESNELIKIKKKYNRRSSQNIINTCNLIRNDQIKQKSIYENFDMGKCEFYIIGENNPNLENYLKEMALHPNTTFLLMKNENIVQKRNFYEIYSYIKSQTLFSGENYGRISNEFLTKNPNNLGWFFRQILAILDFCDMLMQKKSTINVIIDLLPKGNYSYLNIKKFVKYFNENISLGSTLRDTINILLTYSDSINGLTITKKLLQLDENIQTSEDIWKTLNNRSVDYFGEPMNDISNSMKNHEKNFFDFKIEELLNWVKYINDKGTSDGYQYFTLHGSKGLEFENVVVVIENSFARKKDYCKYYFENYLIKNPRDKNYFEFRNLFYVACSRAIKDLKVIYLNDNCSELERQNIKSIFGSIQELDNK